MRKPSRNSDDPIVLAPEDHDLRVELGQRLFAAIYAASRRAISEGHASSALIAAGIRSAVLVDQYAAGYLLPQHRGALGPVDLASVAPIDPFGCLLLPASAPGGPPTELCCYRLDSAALEFVGTLALSGHRPALLAPRISQVSGDLVLTDRLDDLIRRLAAEQRQVLLLRSDLACGYQLGLIHAINGDHRITIASGPRNDDIRAACVEHGLDLAVSTQAPWLLDKIDRKYHRAIFRSAEIEVTVDTPYHARTQFEVVVRVGDQRPYGDTIDLRFATIRSTFCDLVAAKTGCDAALLGGLLDDGIVKRLELIERTNGIEEQVSTAQAPRTVAVAFPAEACDSADLISGFTGDMHRLGWCGDHRSKTLCLLALVGSQLDHPPWLVLRGPADATLPITGLLFHLRPEEDLILPSRTNRSLVTGDEP